jgi:tetratricopeptide (TPR) repeat protein
MNRIYILCLGFVILLTVSCKNKQHKDFKTGQQQVLDYIKKGDNIYRTKSGTGVFIESMVMYDSAWSLALQFNDSLLLAESVFAKGRAFDALNNNPQKTIDFYQNAANLFEKFSKDKIKSYYIKHLVAHAYEKAGDSANAIITLSGIVKDFSKLDSAQFNAIDFVPQMALIASTVKNFDYAEFLLNTYCKIEQVKNNPQTYPYLYSYLLTRANIDVYGNKDRNSPYLDSIDFILSQVTNASDSLFYTNELWSMYKSLNDKPKAAHYLELNNTLFNNMVSLSKTRLMDQKISDMEKTISNLEKNNLENKSNLRLKYISILTFLLSIISILTIYLLKKNKLLNKKQNEINPEFKPQMQLLLINLFLL